MSNSNLMLEVYVSNSNLMLKVCSQLAVPHASPTTQNGME